jgi:predicted DsbA family dithiol-disulfide isomerase
MLVLYHDYTSPASAVAVARVHRLMREGMPARVRGTEVFGLDATLPVTVDLLAALDAMAEEAAAEGIELHRPAVVPPTALAHVVEDVAREHALDVDWRDCCYGAYWRDGSDIADPDRLRRLAADAGLPAEAVDRALDDRLALLAVRQRSAGDRREGIGGVPTIKYDRSLVPGLLPDSDLRTLAALGHTGP